MPEDTPAFIEQAKWLIERHTRRSEGLATRSAAILGFTGVTLALLLQAINALTGPVDAWTWTSLTLTTALLLATAFCCIRSLSTTETAVPSTAQLRQWWDTHRHEPQADTYSRNIAETLLNATNLDDDSPIDTAKNLADRRARWFRRATWTLLAALSSMSTPIIELIGEATRR